MAVKIKERAASKSAEPQATQSPLRHRRQRAESEQNASEILRAATEVLGVRPEASMTDIARSAGVSRQTVYAHYPSREALLEAIVGQAIAEAMAALDAAGLMEAPPAEALIRLLDADWAVGARYPFLWQLPEVGQDADGGRHGPMLGRMREIIRRGQEAGDFDGSLSPDWLLTVSLALGRAVGEEIIFGRMTSEDAASTVHRSFLRLLGLR
jgi:AcrR family transcriptional regulator